MSDTHRRMEVDAVAFAVRAGHTNEMAHRFLEQVCQAGRLGQPRTWGVILTSLTKESE